jgi:hypothetical protein
VETASRSPHLLSPRCERSSAGPSPACYGRRGGARVETCPPGQCAAVARAGAHVALAAMRAITHVEGKAIGSSRRRTPATRPEQARAGPALGALASGRKRAQGRDAVSSLAPHGCRSDQLPASGELREQLSGRACVGVAASMSPRPLAPRAAVEPIGDSSSRSAPEASARCPPRAARSSRAAVADRSGEPRADRAQRHPRLSRAGCSCCGGRRCRGRTWP